MPSAPHIKLAHQYWKKHLREHAVVIDATCGNGHDALFIAQQILSQKGELHCFDIQQQAINATQTRLKKNLPKAQLNQIFYYHKSHDLLAFSPRSIDLIVYNLGYLPHSNKQITTKVKSTLSSIAQALNVIADEGMISITCYPGHTEGKFELEAIEKYLKALSPKKFHIYHHIWKDRLKSPQLIIIYSKKLN
jgi:methylase of polypeptide subunit release factors